MATQQQAISVEILEQDQNNIKFAVNNIDLYLANALRRIILSEIPTMAIDLVSIYNNTTVLNSEMISQRLGLIPLVSDRVDQFQFTKDCECKPSEKCNVCKVFFQLKVKCNNEDPNETQEVTSQDLKMISEQDLNGDLRPVLPVVFKNIKGQEVGVPIVKIRKNQELILECEARKGIAKIHAKWQPVSLGNIQHVPVIKLDENINDLDINDKEKIIASCPVKVFEINKNNRRIEIAKLDNCMFCGECEKILDSIKVVNSERLIKITTRKDRFIFQIESTGVLPPQQIVKMAFAVLGSKLNDIKESLEQN